MFSTTDQNASNIDVICKATITATCPVTAIDCLQTLQDTSSYLAIGLEDGSLGLYAVHHEDFSVSPAFMIPSQLSPSRSITQLAWRPNPAYGASYEQAPLWANGVDEDRDSRGLAASDAENFSSEETTNGKDSEQDQGQGQEQEARHQLAVASEDGSVRIFAIRL